MSNQNSDILFLEHLEESVILLQSLLLNKKNENTLWT